MVKVALDLDGVIWDLVKPWVDKYNIIYNDNVDIYSIKEYNLSKSLTKASYNDIKNILFEKSFWDNVYPFKNSFEYLNKLNSEFDLYIATKTDYRIFKTKVDRLLSLFPFLNKDQIICIANKSLLNVDWLVDDCDDNLIGGNFKKIILDAPYNKDSQFLRAYDLKDAYNIIKFYKG